ncbi:hypothetical protein [Sulfitobacter faviae]|uniref:hypothetical protein n=1 Tax=Sulfitobacter faviae TaxID=1775881 RepID=UPI00398CA479
MLQATRDIRNVALWLGHATLQSTEIYLPANPTEKIEMLDRWPCSASNQANSGHPTNFL